MKSDLEHLHINFVKKNCMFCYCSHSLHTDYAKKENKLLMYIGDFHRQLDYLYNLIKTINVQNLTQVRREIMNAFSFLY